MRKFTKRSLALQFIQMCEKVPLKKITVKSFLEFADISKQTFYNYFKDKDDLMNYSYGVAADSIIVDMDTSLEGIYYGAAQMGYECLKHKNFYMQMAKYETQNSFAQHFSRNVESVYRRKLTELGYLTESDVQRQQIVHYFCVGICTFYIDWIYSGMNESPDYVASTIIECMPVGIKEAFGSNGSSSATLKE